MTHVTVKEPKSDTAACSNQLVYNRDPLGHKEHNAEKGNYVVSSRLRNPTVILQVEIQHDLHWSLRRLLSPSSESCNSTSSNDLSPHKSKKCKKRNLRSPISFCFF